MAGEQFGYAAAVKGAITGRHCKLRLQFVHLDRIHVPQGCGPGALITKDHKDVGRIKNKLTRIRTFRSKSAYFQIDRFLCKDFPHDPSILHIVIQRKSLAENTQSRLLHWKQMTKKLIQCTQSLKGTNILWTKNINTI